MKYCPKCNTPNELEAAFCGSCGTPFPATQAAAPAQPTYATQPAPTYPPQAPTYPPQAAPAYPPQAPQTYPPQAAPAYPPQAPQTYPPQAAPVYPPQAPQTYPPQAAPTYPPQPPVGGVAAAAQPYPPQPYPPQAYPGQVARPANEAVGAAQAAGMILPAGTAPAGFGIRLGAFLIDGVVLYAINYVVGNTLGSVVGIVYYIAMWALMGRTLGKLVLGLRVVSTDGQPLSWGKAVLRYVGYIVSSLILCIGFLMIAFDGAKRGLHDRMAKTIVVRSL